MVSADVRVARVRVMFKGPGPQVNGLEAVPEGLWLSDQRDNRTYLVDYAGSVWVASNIRPSMVFRHDPESGHCTACLVLPNADQGGVHGVQWRPYELGVQPPASPEARPELHPTAPAGRHNAGPGVSGTLWVTRPGAKVIDHLDAETAELLGQIPFPAARSHGLFWDEADNSLSVVETNHGHVYKLDPRSGEVLDEWRIEGAEVHAMTRDAQGRIWIGDAATNELSVVEPA
jgi:hypothetical protein